MAFTAKPEVLAPRLKRGSKAFDDENLDLLSHVLDDFIKIPGTSIRFGLDGIVGFIPGIGDVTALFYTAFNEAVLGTKTPQQALDDGVAKADKLLEDNRKKYGS